ncbi:MAG: NYN domain-containing protein [Clostridiales bacterium]|nr:NYN domain-containing protein [Clostridiales bacterium]
MKPLLYVDGYNIIGAWPQAEKENWPLDECRDRLVLLLEDYAGYTGQEVWVVFDGYRTERPQRTVEPHKELTVVYTRHGETADHYIERMCQLLPKYREARVATSDGIEQTLILGRGATRLSAREFWREVNRERADGRGRYTTHARSAKPSVGSGSLRSALSAEQFRLLDELRRQK